MDLSVRCTTVGVIDQALAVEDLPRCRVLRVEDVFWSAPRALSPEILGALRQVVHDLIPRLARRGAEQCDEGYNDVLEVPMLVERFRRLRGGEEADPQDAEENKEQQEYAQDICQLRDREDQRHKDLVQPLEEAEKPPDSEDPDDRGDRPDRLQRGHQSQDQAKQRHRDAKEVETIPRISPVARAQSEELEAELHCEYEGEDAIRGLQHNLPPSGRQREDLEHHEDRVDDDRRHDRALEVLIGDEVVGLPAVRRQPVQVGEVEEGGPREEFLLGHQPLLLRAREHEALPLSLQVHKLVHDHAYAEIEQEHEAQEDVDHEERRHAQGRITLWLQVVAG
mmetsp:Transcript_148339/g.385699  ORF Transcript_148339/g.385699 Transcript_148339/m.385699 type:complete len:337 (+) Transcript_148339:1220-2230(+)